MTEQERIEATEAALRAACVEARMQGLVLVRDVDIVRTRGVVGCCAVWAHDIVNQDSDGDLDLTAPEYDAIQHGWDGTQEHAERDGLPMPWFDLGARLAAEFRPVPASTLVAR